MSQLLSNCSFNTPRVQLKCHKPHPNAEGCCFSSYKQIAKSSNLENKKMSKAVKTKIPKQGEQHRPVCSVSPEKIDASTPRVTDDGNDLAPDDSN